MTKEITQEKSLFEGINLSAKREENETYEDYRLRLKENQGLLKLYNRIGREQMKELFPEGIKVALDTVKTQGNEVQVEKKEDNKFQSF